MPTDDPPPPDPATALFAEERAALAMRRRIVLGEAAERHPDELALPRAGLALSGGGVRSATFALGLMRGLAQGRSGPADPARRTLASEGLLSRFDYLSTVSGGGYIGAMYGRLADTFGWQAAQAELARSDSPVLHWLRRNGRYLLPSGSRDLGIAAVTYLRAWVAIHTEFMFACMLLGLVVLAPHLFQHTTQVLDANGWSRWVTPWWAAAAASWVLVAPGLFTGYWAARDSADPDARGAGPVWRDLVLLVLLGAVAVFLLQQLWSGQRVDLRRDALNWPTAIAFALVSGVLGQALVQGWMAAGREPHALLVARVRNRLTRALRVVTLLAAGVAGLGALDALSWWVLEELQSGNDWLWGGFGLGSVGVVVLRTMVQPLQQMATEAGAHARDLLPRLVDLASLLGLVALTTAWLVVMQWFVFAPETFAVFRNWPAWLRAGLVAAVWALWVGLTACNAQMANTSSLHSFYRARLARAYLSVGNRRRALDGRAAGRDDVTVVVDGDDTALDQYRPEVRGGPIHLVNTCLNQTRDDRSGLYNADRKGTGLTATWRGLEVGPREFEPLHPGSDTGTLGRWVAVSGAAASPGAGAYTSRGLALLVYFLGVRLGHWVRAPRERVRLRWLSRLGWRCCPKPLMLASEASANFYGVERPWWFLSDGGHFENTGVYPLLKRELDFIVLSDAGTDAAYTYLDIENLVRKARIDFGAEIDFYTREEAARLFTLAGSDLTVLSPEDLADNHSCRGVLLARIRYRERPGVGGVPFRPEGTMLVVKPNLHDALDVDLLAYARQHPDFPHESTGDQSFDEAQWESYHRLGEDFGRALHDTWLAQLPGWRAPARHAMRVAARLGTTGPASPAGRTEPLWRRGARAAAIGTTLGLGATGTLLLSVWQVQEAFVRNRADQQAEARQLFGEVSKGLQAIDGACPAVPEVLVSQVSLLLDLRGSPALRALERAGLDRLTARLGDQCARPATASAECPAQQNGTFAELCSLALKPQTENTALNYWHPGASPAEQARAAGEVLRGALPAGLPMPVPVDVMPRPEPAAVAASGPVPEPTTLAAACQRASGFTTLYIQVYDESSRRAASALARAVRRASAGSMQIAPIENVARTAELRQQRRPVPWAQATFVLHDPASRGCATALSAFVREPWVVGEAEGQVWVRDLPATLTARRAGVIELWLPPVPASAGP